MTIAEIESTLNKLRSLHTNLDEGTLITLLTAGGWEEKSIQEAVSIFRSTVHVQPLTTVSPLATTKEVVSNANSHLDVESVTPVNVVKPVLENKSNEEIVYYDSTGNEEKKVQLDISDTNSAERVQYEKSGTNSTTITPPLNGEEKMVIPSVEVPVPQILSVIPPVVAQSHDVITSNEPQSLVSPTSEQSSSVKQVEIPDDLPMRPFESAPHIWPFSKYKQVFHGDVMPPLSEEERILANKNMPPKKVLTKKVVVKRTGFDGEDEGLILMTGFSLLVIILLLAYMYSNGRI